MTNILVTGANGQVGSELQEFVNAQHPISYSPYPHFFFTDRNELDITDKDAVAKFVETNRINVIINCAAYTAVDRAEEEESLVESINHLAVRNLAQISKEKGIRLVHISTDYVFDGKNYRPYTEEDATNPQGVYGKTKLDGEKAMLAINPENSVVIRTSWVYSSFGNNFVKTMLRLGKERESLGVIYDQVGTPTYARDLAKTILNILPKIQNEDVEIYHYSNEGVLSWYDFAKEIMQMAKLECQIDPIETKEYPTPAKRPHYSLLNKAKIKNMFNITIPYWKDSLDECLYVMGERK
ncbi:MAG: dTDP-4-dehydrorhamnose reductase [Epsilonproteobacteria bacterium (ex Lamellibrachia satsuma)]|nr:MAG: dTDP-4-dehydrorhamnose reductase [Epsilonproteobacteria bacterium (ex Lamellibrachia satsuma)]